MRAGSLVGILSAQWIGDGSNITCCARDGLATHLLGGSFSVIPWRRDGYRGTSAPNGADEQGFIDWIDGDPEIVETLIRTRAIIGTPK